MIYYLVFVNALQEKLPNKIIMNEKSKKYHFLMLSNIDWRKVVKIPCML